MEENREKNNKKIEDEKRLEQDLRQMADDVILPDSLEPEAIQKMLQARQEEKQQGSKAKKKKKNWKKLFSKQKMRTRQRHGSFLI